MLTRVNFETGLLRRAITRFHGTWNHNAPMTQATFILRDGTSKTVYVPIGTTLLEAAHQHQVDLEGACEGGLACSTCHVIVNDKKLYDDMGAMVIQEEDLLDMAPGVTDFSRLACQCILDDKWKAFVDAHGEAPIRLPPITKNFYIDGFTPEGH